MIIIIIVITIIIKIIIIHVDKNTNSDITSFDSHYCIISNKLNKEQQHLLIINKNDSW